MNDTPSVLGSNYEIHVPVVSADTYIFRYYLQSVAREILNAAKLEKRVRTCQRYIAPKQDRVRVKFSPTRKRASFGNLLTCGELWVCPVCASRITERRAAELKEAAAVWRKRHKGHITLNTYTLQHNIRQSLAEVVATLTKAFGRFKSGKPYIRLEKRFKIAGCIRAVEILYGENGWHAHIHELVFHGKLDHTTRKKYVSECTERWMNCLLKSGGDGIADIAFDSRAEHKAVSDYIAKFGREPITQTWGLEREISKAPSKVGRKGGRSAFDLLADAGAGDTNAARLYVEYVRMTHNMRFLRWSTGLQELLGLKVIRSDQDAAKESDIDAFALGYIRAEGWRALMRLPRDVRVEILLVGQSGSYEAVHQWCLARSIAFEREDTNDEKPVSPEID